MDAALTSGVLDKSGEKKAIEYTGLNKADVKLVVSIPFGFYPRSASRVLNYCGTETANRDGDLRGSGQEGTVRERGGCCEDNVVAGLRMS